MAHKPRWADALWKVRGAGQDARNGYPRAGSQVIILEYRLPFVWRLRFHRHEPGHWHMIWAWFALTYGRGSIFDFAKKIEDAAIQRHIDSLKAAQPPTKADAEQARKYRESIIAQTPDTKEFPRYPFPPWDKLTNTEREMWREAAAIGDNK